MWARNPIIESARTSATISYLINTLSTYGTERRLFGRTNPEVSQRFDTLVTPKGWAFAIWAFIFIGETLGLLFMWTNSTCAAEFNDILVPFTYACLLQSLWCVFFAKEQMFLSAVALSGIAFNLKACSDEIFIIAASESISKIPYIAEVFVSYPIRIHFAWTTAAALINWNMLVVSFKTPAFEVFPALISVWIAAGVAAFRALFLGDAIFPAVLAWAFAAMSAKIRSSPPEHFAKDSHFLEVLETTYDFLSMNMWVASALACAIDYSFSVSGFEYVSYKSWAMKEMSGVSPYIFGVYIFAVWNIAIIQHIYCNKGTFLWK